jgi:uncharacterized protein YndB with AHSA1/START domain
MNGTLNTVDGRPALRFERRLAHPVERVWRAVSEPPELSQWFVAPVPWKPESGETFEAHGQRGEVLDLEAPSVLAWSWAGELFRFELSADGDGCLLVFTHVFDDPPLGAQHAAGWDGYLDRLGAHLEGRHLSEEQAYEGVAERNARYAEQFAASGGAASPLSLRGGPDPAPRAPLPALRRARLAGHLRARRAGALVPGRRAAGGHRERAPAGARGLLGRGCPPLRAQSGRRRQHPGLHPCVRRPRYGGEVGRRVGSLLRTLRGAARRKPDERGRFAGRLAGGARPLCRAFRRRSGGRTQGVRRAPTYLTSYGPLLGHQEAQGSGARDRLPAAGEHPGYLGQ